MKQPELGQRISELRKSKNLTQEELVEECNVSVRTIQRIESGEVIPRTSTIKIILAALGEDFSTFKESYTGNSQAGLLKMENGLQVAWIAGIIYFMLGFLEAGLDYERFEVGDDDISIIFYSSVKLVALAAYILFIGGMIHLGNFFSNTVLKIGSYLLIVFTTLAMGFDVLSLFIPISDESLFVILPAESVSAGCAEIVLGIGLFRLQDGMGRVALLAGVLKMIVGFSFAVIILFLLGFVLLIPAIILEIILLYRGYELIRSAR